MGKGRAPCCDKSKVKRGPWTPDEDFKLITFIQQHGHPNWRSLPSQAGLLRCGKSCRLRWINYLRPDVKRGNFTPKEEETVINLHQAYGNKWSKIASFLPGRTDNEIKNVWNTHLKKRLGIKSTKSSSSRRRKTKKSLDAFVVESSSLKSSSSSSNCDQVDRDNNDTTSLDNETLECKLSATTLREGDERKESPSPSLISCVSNVSVKDRSLVHMDANFDSASSLQGMCMDDLGVLDELRFQIPPEFDESGFWNLIDLDNLCSPQTTEIEARTCKSFEESNATGFNQKHTFTSDPITHWVRNLEIELGLDDME